MWCREAIPLGEDQYRNECILSCPVYSYPLLDLKEAVYSNSIYYKLVLFKIVAW